MRAVLLALALMFAGGGAACADAVADCRQEKDRDLSIRGCTRIIEGKAQENKAAAYNNRGNAYNDKGEYDRAIIDFNEAIRLDPKLAFAYNGRGNAYNDKGEYDRAIADYNEAIRLDPKNAVAYYSRGLAYYNKGEYDRAIADYNEAIRLDPKDAIAYNNRGNAYYYKGDYDRAIADYDEAIRLDPKYVDAYNGRGSANRDKGEYERAIADYNEAIRLDPKNAYAYGGRCRVMFKTGKLEAAKADIEKAISLDKSRSFLFYRRGYIRLASGDRDGALADFNEALRLESDAVSALSGRGQVYEALGKTALAIADYRKAIDGKTARLEDKEAQAKARERLAALEQAAKVAAAPPPAATPTVTAPPAPPAPAPVRPAGRRVALVIGNNTYRELSQLGNPVDDAGRVAAELRTNGYEVLDVYNLTREQFLDALDRFRQRYLGGATDIFVFYAGHGMAIGGRDVLAPIDLSYDCDERSGEMNVRRDIPLEEVERQLRGASSLVIVLDACRNNAFQRCTTRGQADEGFRGLSRTARPGTLIVNSTSPGALAKEGGRGEGSPFARVLVRRMKAQRESLYRELFDDVAAEVSETTQGAQVPDVLARGGAPRSCLSGRCGSAAR